MNYRCARVAAVLLAAFAAMLPPLAGAQSGNLRLNFSPPKDWTDSTRPNDRPGVWKDWVVRDGGAVHSIVLSVTRESRPAAEYGPANVEAMKSIPGVTLLESGPATTCGDVPAFTYTYRSDRTPGHPMIIRHVLVDVGSLLGDVSYAHPPDVADRSDAVDALSTFCDQQIYAIHAPAGWKSIGMSSPGNPGVGGFTSPSGDATVIGIAVAVPARIGAMFLTPNQTKDGMTLLSEGDETCGAQRVHRTRWRQSAEKGPQLVEMVAGYHHGASYLYSYTHPESAPADTEAQRALTSFCDTGATLATPAPAK